MNTAYIQLLPTVFVQAAAFPGLQASQAVQAGAAGVVGLADSWDDEPTRPDRVLPADVRQRLQASQAPADLPAHIARELGDRYQVEPRELRQLRSWMESHHLRVNHFSKAVEYLNRMRRELEAQAFDDEPTVRITVRRQDRLPALVSQTAL